MKLFLPVILLLGSALALSTSSCNVSKQAVYFNDSSDYNPRTRTEPIMAKYEPVIQADDILAVNVTSISSISVDKTGAIDPVLLYNSGGTNYSITAGNSQSSADGGYLVNAAGNINFPVLGDVHVAGLKISEAKKLLEDKLKTHLVEPVVEVRIINYRVTILGEIGQPGQVLAPNQNMTILDAIAASGDIPLTGRKDNIRLIRENNGQREYATIDLTKKDFLNSPYYYLKQNDILIVDASKVKRQEANTFTRVWLPLVSSLLGFAFSVATFAVIYTR